MSETIPGYGACGKPVMIDRLALRGKMAMYLHGQVGDAQGRALIRDAILALSQAEQEASQIRRNLTALLTSTDDLGGTLERLGRVLPALEGLISDGK
jgi:allophanate hydrolase subunit 2